MRLNSKHKGEERRGPRVVCEVERERNTRGHVRCRRAARQKMLLVIPAFKDSLRGATCMLSVHLSFFGFSLSVSLSPSVVLAQRGRAPVSLFFHGGSLLQWKPMHG